MPRLDRATADGFLDRLATLTPGTAPRWGKMNSAQVIGHLNAVVRYTMGELPALPDRSTWFSRWVFKPLIVHGLVAIPHNVKIPSRPGKPDPVVPEGTLDQLRATIDEYLARSARGDLGPAVHPFFGVLSAATWAKFHYRHFEHHLTQFGV